MIVILIIIGLFSIYLISKQFRNEDHRREKMRERLKKNGK